MICPKCGYDNKGKPRECLKCGIIFEKWQNSQPKQNPPEPDAPPPPRPRQTVYFPKWMMVLLVIGVALFLLRFFMSGKKEPVNNTESQSIPQKSETTESRPEKTPIPLERLDDIIFQMNAEAAGYGIQFTRKDLRDSFEGGHFVNLHPGSLNTVVDQAGLTPPTFMETSREDRKIISKNNFLIYEVKCQINGEWVYSRDLPETDGGASECWKCRGGSMKGGYSNCRKWEQYRWQPNFKKWSAYSEQDEIRGLEYKIHERLYTSEVINKDREISQTMLNRNVSDDPEKQKEQIRKAIMKAYNSRILREGALHRLEELNELLQ